MKKTILEAGNQIANNINSLRFSEEEKPPMKVSPLVTIGWETVLAEPPANNSDTTKLELELLSKITMRRTQSERDLVYLVDKDVKDLFFPLMRKHNLNFPAKQIEKLYYDIVHPVIMNLKWQYNRPRPYQLAPKYGIQISILKTDTHKTPAYPSGHTAYAATFASVLAELYPKYSSDFYELANIAGKARELQGVHYPSDNDASMVIVSALWENVKYNI
jgi:acid phosphatase (class A)